MRASSGLVSCAGIAFLALAAAGCHRRADTAQPSSPPVGEVWLKPEQAREAHVATARAAPRQIADAILAPGRIAFDDLHVAHVYSPVTGRVRQITAEFGQRVKKGQSLLSIDSPDMGLAVADLQKAEADVTAAKHNFDRQSELFALHAASQRDYESASDDYRKAQAELERSREKTHLLRLGSASTERAFVLTSPIDGEVIDRSVSPGMEVQGEYAGGPAIELFTIGEADPVWALADVYEMDLSRVRLGEQVSVSVVAYPDRKFEGKVDWASSTLDPGTRTIRVRCTLPNVERLLHPGMYATLSIQTEVRSALAVPRTAVLHLGGQTIAFVPLPSKDGMLRFARRAIAVDEDVEGDRITVLSGLVQGEVVVTSGAILLSGQ
jgi:cobalt-zinc-cadmium efflux system membrane fusion protein